MSQSTEGHTDVSVAELIGGPFDGHLFPNKTGGQWPEFLKIPLGSEFPWSTDALRRSKSRNRDAYLMSRMVLYRFEPLANGKMQYVFDKRYNR